MAFFSSGMPSVSVYLVLPSRIALIPASLMLSGVSKSGSPTLSEIDVSPLGLQLARLVGRRQRGRRLHTGEGEDSRNMGSVLVRQRAPTRQGERRPMSTARRFERGRAVRFGPAPDRARRSARSSAAAGVLERRVLRRLAQQRGVLFQPAGDDLRSAAALHIARTTCGCRAQRAGGRPRSAAHGVGRDAAVVNVARRVFLGRLQCAE